MSSNPYEAPKASLDNHESNETLVFDETSPFSPKGRFGRADYVVFAAGFSIIYVLVMGIISALLGLAGGETLVIVVTIVLYIFAIYFGFVFLIRRLHDMNWSGWLSILTLIPVINLGIYIPALFFKGTVGANDYGPPRRYVKSRGVIAGVLAGVAIIAVIGMMAAVAIPAYQDYLQRAQDASLSQPN